LDRQIKYKRRRKEFANRVKTFIGCISCGFDKHPAALDFHHLDKNKKENLISIMTKDNSTISKLKLEMKKCIVVCANCHRIFHAENNKGI
jgi:hypothetical protein